MIPSGYPLGITKKVVCFFYSDTQQVPSWYPLGITTLHTSGNMCMGFWTCMLCH